MLTNLRLRAPLSHRNSSNRRCILESSNGCSVTHGCKAILSESPRLATCITRQCERCERLEAKATLTTTGWNPFYSNRLHHLDKRPRLDPQCLRLHLNIEANPQRHPQLGAATQ